MRKILILGAGHSTPYAIRHLLEHAQELEAQVTVADRSPQAAEARVAGHERGRAVQFDVHDADQRRAEIAAADVVLHFLPPVFQPLVASECVELESHMISVSYRARELAELDAEAARRGILLLPEMGLDPGIDLMSARSMIEQIRSQGGRVESFRSYGGGLPAPEKEINPLRYCITWNPRNVVMAAEDGAQFLRGGRIRMVPWQRVFATTWDVEVPGLGTLEAYANRDSLTYVDALGLDGVEELVRGTLRYPGWCETWHQVVRLGLPNERISVPRLAERTFAELVAMFVPPEIEGPSLRHRLAEWLGLEAEAESLDRLEWLGLFSEETIACEGSEPAQALVALFNRRLALPDDARDLVVLHHEIEAGYPDRRERLVSTFIDRGEPGGVTAMAKSVGLPAALAARRLLEDRLPLTGSRLPTEAVVYEPILEELARQGLVFQEKVEEIAGETVSR